jgi:diamine N-acetyltransferase
MINIREVTVEDTVKLKRLLMELVEEKPPIALELEPLVMKGRRWISEFPKESMGHFIVSEEGDKIVGFCYVAIPKFYRPVAYIGIAIDKEYRKNDIGSRMFYRVAEWAVNNQVQYIIADIWSWNTKALKFFEKLGFAKKEVFKDKFRGKEEDKVSMIKDL